MDPPSIQPSVHDISKHDFTQFTKHGENILLLIPTENKFKVGLSETTVRAKLKPMNRDHLLIPHVQNFDSNVGQQPYDEKGLEGACNRIRNALDWLSDNKQILKDKNVGTVLVAAIENFIQRGEVAVDYGMVVVYNATLNEAAAACSEGVPVQQEFLKKAEAWGFDDIKGRKCGKRTVGKILQEIFGIDGADWHEIVCGTSRYVLLRGVMEKLKMPLY